MNAAATWSPAQAAQLNDLLAQYVGTHNFHNFTAQGKVDPLGEPQQQQWRVSWSPWLCPWPGSWLWCPPKPWQRGHQGPSLMTASTYCLLLCHALSMPGLRRQRAAPPTPGSVCRDVQDCCVVAQCPDGCVDVVMFINTLLAYAMLPDPARCLPHAGCTPHTPPPPLPAGLPPRV